MDLPYEAMKKALPCCFLLLTTLYPLPSLAFPGHDDDHHTVRPPEARRVAMENGYRDGVKDGRDDRKHGHSYRPTQLDDFKNADSGYTSNLGDKDDYKKIYRRAFERGYDVGYNNREDLGPGVHH